MRRSWNGWLWGGFAIALAGLFSYIPIFALYPVTRDTPWANFLLLAAGLALLAVGLLKAYRRPQVYRGRVFGAILAVLALAGSGLFCWAMLYLARQLPASAGAPRVGQVAPPFTLPDQDGKPVSLAELISPAATDVLPPLPKTGGAVLIFYRGHW